MPTCIVLLVCLLGPDIKWALRIWMQIHDTGSPPYRRENPTEYLYRESGNRSFQGWPGMHQEGLEPSADVRTQAKVPA